MNIKKNLITITSLIIIGCGSSGDKASSIANNTPTNNNNEIIFMDNFDNHNDWTGDELLLNGKSSLPHGWWAGNSKPLWSPATGHPDRHATMEILEKNRGLTGDQTGKALVFWRENIPYRGEVNGWNSESILFKYLGDDGEKHFDPTKTYNQQSGIKELYVEFDIMVGQEMLNQYYEKGLGSSKVFRVYHYDGEKNKLTSFFEGKQNPAFVWNLGGFTNYGVRNFVALLSRRNNFTGTDASLITKAVPAATRSVNDFSCSYLNSSKGMMPDRSDPIILNQKLNDGTTLQQSGGFAADLDEVFGVKKWNKMGFYLKMNSAPGVNDGVMSQWLNGQRILHIDDIAWVGSERDMVKWNVVAFGGNDRLNDAPIEERKEDWYAIDNIIIRKTIPAELR